MTKVDYIEMNDNLEIYINSKNEFIKNGWDKSNPEGFICLKRTIKEIKKEIMLNCEIIKVCYMHGGREFTENVVKVGKSFYDGSRRMTKKHGYKNIEILER